MWRQFGLVVLISTMAVGVAVHSGLAAENQGVQTVTLQIDGMTCGGCVKDVKAALAKVPGVSVVDLTVEMKWVVFSDYSNARAAVTFDPEKTDVEALIKAVEAASNPLFKYRAHLRDK